MTIKEVEKLTGLTAKSIRFYEAKKLITVGRNEGNAYRDYSEEDVSRLKRIKVFRYLDFSIEEIGQLLNGDEREVKKALEEKAENFAEQNLSGREKREICLSLAKDYKDNLPVLEEYNEAIEFLESEDVAKVIERVAYPNIWGVMAQSFICLGPILWLFINIIEGNQEALLLNAVLALVATIILTIIWAWYIVQRRHYKKKVKRNNRELGGKVPLLIISCIVGTVLFIGFMSFMEKTMAPRNYLFYQHHFLGEIMLMCAFVLTIVLTYLLLNAIIKNRNLPAWARGKRRKYIVILAWVISAYVCTTSVTYVTEDSIVYHSPMNPRGITYSYSDVEKIVTGFGSKTFAIAEYKKKGNFFYQIQVGGKTIVFRTPSVNGDIERYQEDTYLELEEFDRALVNLGIEKEASAKGQEDCKLDTQYVKRFLRIIEFVQ